MKRNSRKLPAFTFKNGAGVKYKIIWKQHIIWKRRPKSRRVDGLCDNPKNPKPKIWIDPSLGDKRLMSVIFEEIFHSFAFEKNEKTARRFAGTLKKLLYKLGWERN